jgi:hypothetical protein
MGQIYESHDVFVPGKVSEITYVHREDRAAENDLATEARRGGKIVSVVGPTKMGKTVLVGKVIQDSLWLEGQWLRTLDDFWTKLAVELHLPTSKSGSTTSGDTAKWSIFAKLGFPGVGGAGASVGGDHKLEKVQSWSTNIPQDQAVTRALKELSAAGRKHSIVIDDFHFVPASVRTEIIQNLKPLTYAGIPAILITLPHRKRDSIAGVEDIGGRTRTIRVKAWLDPELVQIAQKGFKALGVLDPDNKLAEQLARESYGSPELMQRLSLELCETVNAVYKTAEEPKPLSAPSSWQDFLGAIEDEQALAWLERLVSGPKVRGKERRSFELKDGRVLDGYQVILTAMKAQGPQLSMTEDAIKQNIVDLLANAGDFNKVSLANKLHHMSDIATKSLSESAPELEDEDSNLWDEYVEDPVNGSVQPVFEYAHTELPRKVYIIEPFLAFTLRWQGERYLQGRDFAAAAAGPQ